MTREAHTPGPWKVWSSLYTGMAAAVVRDVEPLETVAEVRAYRNATLIAAAPELLEATRAFLAGYPGGINPDLDRARSLARAAVAKAEGRAP